MPDAQPELNGAPLALGIYGKMPAHGDFVRRGLPSSFVTPWDTWLSAGVAAARDQLEEGFAAVWDEAPAWRFSLPAGVCGPDAVAGVMLPSEDTVGRRFPLTAAALLPPGVIPEEAWFARLEAAVRAARQGTIDADGMIRAMQSTPEPEPEAAAGDVLGMLGGGMAGMALGHPGASAAAAPAPSDAGQWRARPDPMDGPAETEAAAPASDMWGALLGEPATDTPPAADPMEGPAPTAGAGDWGALLGDGPISGPGPAAQPAEGGLAGGGDIWGDLLGGAGPGSEQGAPTPAPATAGDWDHLIGDTPSAPPAAAAAAGDAGPVAAGHHGSATGTGDHQGGDSWGGLLPDGAPPAAMPAQVATDRVVAREPAASEVVSVSPGTGAPPLDAPTLHAPVRPPEGGWWTLGGTRLAPMVWPLPELPPAESFILLLQNQDPESGA